MAGTGVDPEAKTIMKVGPGGWKNKDDSEWDAKGISKITRILVSFTKDQHRLNSLQFQYVVDGIRKLSPVYGPNQSHSGFTFQTVELSEEEDEYITKISGDAHDLYPCYKDDKRVTCLKFETNLDSYGPFGAQGPRKFSFDFGAGNHFAGFFGSCSALGISSIGCYYIN